ncbi:hypothetical protein [Streptacidiphilus sp. MAP5-52]|uniref:hypothetical protein n=1 Tax=Streptacidiphilus sp. MAP5-52 TaxID=3156267 RepID=UPI003510FB8F
MDDRLLRRPYENGLDDEDPETCEDERVFAQAWVLFSLGLQAPVASARLSAAAADDADTWLAFHETARQLGNDSAG